MNSIKSESNPKNRKCKCFSFVHFYKLNSNFNSVYFGYDFIGKKEDLEFFDESPECSMFEGIRYLENLIHFINVEFIKHVVVTFNFHKRSSKAEIKKCLIKNKRPDYITWIEKVKRIYIVILSNHFLFQNLIVNNYRLSQFEKVIELVSELEEYICHIKK